MRLPGGRSASIGPVVEEPPSSGERIRLLTGETPPSFTTVHCC